MKIVIIAILATIAASLPTPDTTNPNSSNAGLKIDLVGNKLHRRDVTGIEARREKNKRFLEMLTGNGLNMEFIPGKSQGTNRPPPSMTLEEATRAEASFHDKII
ncbi:hypothetical protein TWF694_010282 [Orbilia ellipsospora]|uniref:Uncharacterized protein n=1 Tax=Orbilia ellipsospora TaxID=2528407 RepID=A0AAV9XAK8_9PEZI